jgi:surface polysaccharide O-acyltransferase-like enzyme
MKGLKRYKPHTVRVALPITPKILLKIKNELESTDINSYTYWSIFFYAFYLMCRKSNLVGTAEDDSKCLYRGDIKVFKEYLIVKFQVPSQGHYGFHSFRLLTDFVCLYNYEF